MSRQIEETLVGTLLQVRQLRELILDITDARHFPNLNVVYLEVCRQHSEGMMFDEVTIASALEPHYPVSFLLDLQMYAIVDEEKIKAYARVLKEESDKKRIGNLARELNMVATDPNTTMDDVLMKISSLHSDAEEATEVKALTPEEIFDRERSEPKKEKLLTGVKVIDQDLYQYVGLHRGDINVILADSGHGKTQLASYLASNLVINDYQGLWFQMEDYDVNTAKHIAITSAHKSNNIRIIDSIDDIDEIKRQCRIVKQNNGLDFVVVDYIQEVYAKGKFDSRTLELNYVTKILKQIAKELNVLILVCSQVTINDNTRHGWSLEPKYKDAQWAQVIKNIANCMTSVFRPNMVETLIGQDGMGGINVRGWKEDQRFLYESVFVKVVKSRRGMLTHNRLRLEHLQDSGLSLPRAKF